MSVTLCREKNDVTNVKDPGLRRLFWIIQAGSGNHEGPHKRETGRSESEEGVVTEAGGRDRQTDTDLKMLCHWLRRWGILGH